MSLKANLFVQGTTIICQSTNLRLELIISNSFTTTSFPVSCVHTSFCPIKTNISFSTLNLPQHLKKILHHISQYSLSFIFTIQNPLSYLPNCCTPPKSQWKNGALVHLATCIPTNLQVTPIFIKILKTIIRFPHQRCSVI